MSLTLATICPACFQEAGEHADGCVFSGKLHRAALKDVQLEYENLLDGIFTELARLRAIVGEQRGELHPGATVHWLKTDPRPFMAVCIGIKAFEFRKNDRDYQPGDALVLQECIDGRLTGRAVHVITTYIVYGPNYGVPPDYCVMSIVPAAKELRLEDNARSE